jgi:hypothetical protein
MQQQIIVRVSEKAVKQIECKREKETNKNTVTSTVVVLQVFATAT